MAIRYEFAEQWNSSCVVIQPGDTAEHVIKLAIEAGATYFDGEDTNYCVRFPDRPQDLYTKEALLRSKFPLTASQRALEYARVFVEGDLIPESKLHLAAQNIQQIMADIQAEAIEQAAQICETVPAGNRETVAMAIRGLLPPEGN